MKKLNKKLIVIVPLVFAFIVTVLLMISEINVKLLNVKYREVERYIFRITRNIELSINRRDDWNTYKQFYIENLKDSISALDADPKTYAGLFDIELVDMIGDLERNDVDSSDNIRIKKSRKYDDPTSRAVFNPTEYPNFVTTVMTSNRGHVQLIYKDKENGTNDQIIYCYYRWVPLGRTVPDNQKMLLVVGFSHKVLNIQTDWFLWLIFVINIVIVIGTTLFATISIYNHKSNAPE